MEPTAYIDSYFKGELTQDEKEQFEKKIIDEPAFAEEVAFYVSSLQILKEGAEEEKKKHFREIYQQARPDITTRIVRKMWPSIAVAALLVGIILGVYLFMQPISTKQLADRYIQEHLQSLSVKMGKSDSMQTAITLYNDGKLTDALLSFENMIQSDTSNFDAKENAGIISLRLQHYDKALDYFHQMETYSDRYSNRALFYQSLTLMKRNRPGDAEKAKQLLQQVVQYNLDGKEFAEEWLKKF